MGVRCGGSGEDTEICKGDVEGFNSTWDAYFHPFIHLTHIYWACDVAVTVLGTGNTTVNQTNQDKPEAVEERKGRSGPVLGELTLHQLIVVKQLLY